MGVSYKRNVGDLRQSPALEIIKILANKGATVDYSDPFVPDVPTIKNKKFNNTSVELTKDNEVLTLCIAYDYGGRTEIVDAVKLIVSDCIQQDQITEEVICRNLYTRNLPDPDLVIRTAGEMRLSNFLLWQSAYAEFYSTNVCWPDFDEMEARKALISYSQRKRRYGKLELG